MTYDFTIINKNYWWTGTVVIHKEDYIRHTYLYELPYLFFVHFV